jgi:hypothetical protein
MDSPATFMPTHLLLCSKAHGRIGAIIYSPQSSDGKNQDCPLCARPQVEMIEILEAIDTALNEADSLSSGVEQTVEILRDLRGTLDDGARSRRQR